MESVGEILKQAREAQGLSLEQVASQTKIQEPFIRALEEGHFEALPERVFAKGFVRTYARSLGMDEDDAVRRFSESSGSYYDKGEEEKRQEQQRVEEDRKGKYNRNVVIALTGALLVGLIFLLPREQSPSPESSISEGQEVPRGVVPPSEISSGGTPVSPENGGLPNGGLEFEGQSPPFSRETGGGDFATRSPQAMGEEGGAEPVSPPKAMPAVIPVPANQVPSLGSIPETSGIDEKALVLELEAVEITWVVVRSDEGEPQEALLQPGETARWKADERFFLTLGNAGGVEVSLNGEPLGSFGEHGSVVREREIKP